MNPRALKQRILISHYVSVLRMFPSVNNEPDILCRDKF